MNFKDRGVTIGDLILILIFVISTFFIITKVKESDQEAYFQMPQHKILTARIS